MGTGSSGSLDLWLRFGYIPGMVQYVASTTVRVSGGEEGPPAPRPGVNVTYERSEH